MEKFDSMRIFLIRMLCEIHKKLTGSVSWPEMIFSKFLKNNKFALFLFFCIVFPQYLHALLDPAKRN